MKTHPMFQLTHPYLPGESQMLDDACALLRAGRIRHEIRYADNGSRTLWREPVRPTPPPALRLVPADDQQTFAVPTPIRGGTY